MSPYLQEVGTWASQALLSAPPDSAEQGLQCPVCCWGSRVCSPSCWNWPRLTPCVGLWQLLSFLLASACWSVKWAQESHPASMVIPDDSISYSWWLSQGEGGGLPAPQIAPSPSRSLPLPSASLSAWQEHRITEPGQGPGSVPSRSCGLEGGPGLGRGDPGSPWACCRAHRAVVHTIPDLVSLTPCISVGACGVFPLPRPLPDSLSTLYASPRSRAAVGPPRR